MASCIQDLQISFKIDSDAWNAAYRKVLEDQICKAIQLPAITLGIGNDMTMIGPQNDIWHRYATGNFTTSTATAYADWAYSDQWDATYGLSYETRLIDPSKLALNKDVHRQITMPDGSVIHLDSSGNYRIEDSKAVVTYRANTQREFNPFISCHDIMEEFVAFCKGLGLRSGQFRQLPLELFMRYLVYRAAQQDGDEVPPEATVEAQRALLPPVRDLHRCLACGRFIRHALAAQQLFFCSQEHLGRYALKAGLP
jgi:hypothetical protein